MDLINVGIIDDHQTTRTGIKYLCETHEDYNFIFELKEISDIQDILKLMRKVDILFLDLNLPGTSGINFLEKLNAISPRFKEHTKIIILSVNSDLNHLMKCLGLGAVGFLSKQDDNPDIVEAIRQCYSGKIYISRNVDADHDFLKSIESTDFDVLLSERESEVLWGIANDMTYSRIAAKLGVAEKTIGNHVAKIKEKANIKNKAGLIAYAYAKGYLIQH